jgi:molybdate transport system substrate-binding protein
MKNKLLMVLLFVAIYILGGCSDSSAEKSEEPIVLTVSAASSMKDVLEEMSSIFQNEHSNIEIRFNFGASGSLAQQIEQGAPADLFLSAAVDKFDDLKKQVLLENETTLASNELVLVTSSEADDKLKDFNDLSKDEIDKISIGTPSVVPAGTYAQQALVYYGVWEDIEEKIVYAKDVRQVLTYVETQNVQAGLVYKTDALISDKVKIIATADPKSHDVITYPIGILKNTDYPKEAQLFLDFIKSDDVKNIWNQYGFTRD